MPGYEIFSPDGTLLVRVRRGDYSEIPEKELTEMALSFAPLSKDGVTPHVEGEFKIHAMTEKEYNQSIADQAKLGMPKEDGSRETEEKWLEAVKTMNPDAQKILRNL